VHCDGGTLTLHEGACPSAGCRTYLNANGTETQMVPAVTSEAVRATLLYEWLLQRTDAERDANMEPLSCGRALPVLGLCDKHGVLTGAGRTILAALSQAADPEAWVPRAALQKIITHMVNGHYDGDCPAMFFAAIPGQEWPCPQGCETVLDMERDCPWTQEECWEEWAVAGLAALASVGADPAAPEQPEDTSNWPDGMIAKCNCPEGEGWVYIQAGDHGGILFGRSQWWHIEGGRLTGAYHEPTICRRNPSCQKCGVGLGVPPAAAHVSLPHPEQPTPAPRRPPMLTDERIKELIRGSYDPDMNEALHELRRIRREGHAPEGSIVVRSGKLEWLIGKATHRTGCHLCAHYTACTELAMQRDQPITPGECEARLRQSFGIVPEPEATPDDNR
jgi:hypothetical protein